MDAIGLLTTAAIFSEKSNIELRVFMTVAFPNQPQTTSALYSIDTDSLSGLGIITMLDNTNPNGSVYSFGTFYPDLYIDNGNIDYRTEIRFIGRNSRVSFSCYRSSSRTCTLYIELTSLGQIQYQFYQDNISANFGPYTLPCILVY